MLIFLTNLIRLNFKKILQSPFQSFLLIAINFALFFLSCLHFEEGKLLSLSQFLIVFSIISLSNLLYIYNNITQKLPTISLLRSMGASRAYVIFDFCLEVLLLYVVAALFFAVTLFFYQPFPDYLIFTLYEMLWLIIVSVLVTFLALKRAEKREKGE